MGIAGQILQHALRSAEGRLGVDHPFDAGGLLTQSAKRGQIKVAELAFAETGSQRAQELLSKQTAQHAHRKEEGFTTVNPVRAIRRDSTAGHNAVQVRMKMQILTPGSKTSMSGWVVEDSRVQLDIRGFGVAGSSWRCAFAWILW